MSARGFRVLGCVVSSSGLNQSVTRRAQTDLLIELVDAEPPISAEYAIRRPTSR